MLFFSPLSAFLFFSHTVFLSLSLSPPPPPWKFVLRYGLSLRVHARVSKVKFRNFRMISHCISLSVDIRTVYIKSDSTSFILKLRYLRIRVRNFYNIPLTSQFPAGKMSAVRGLTSGNLFEARKNRFVISVRFRNFLVTGKKTGAPKNGQFSRRLRN